MRLIGYVLLAIAVCFPMSYAQAAVRAATEADLAAMRAAGIQNPTVGTLWDPANPHVGQQAGEAKQYLKSIFKPVTSCTPADEQINKVNDAFALCAARFLKEFNSRYGGAVVTRAYNSVQCETDMCKRGPPGVGNTGCGGFAKIAVSGGAVVSNHVRSVAMDVSAGAKQEQMIAFAHQNPQFGVCFPLASWDKVHLVLGGIPGGERCAQVTKPCDGVNFDPNSIQNPDLTNFRNTAAPTAGPQGIADAIRNYTNPPANTLGASQPLSASTQTSISSVFALPQATTTLFIVPTTTPSTSTNTTAASSTIDILTTISLGASDIATTTSITTPTVTINASDVVSLSPDSQQNLQYVPPQTYTLQGAISSQTFTPSGTTYTINDVPTDLSGIEAVIYEIRVRLDSIAAYLRPYGAVYSPHQFAY